MLQLKSTGLEFLQNAKRMVRAPRNSIGAECRPVFATTKTLPAAGQFLKMAKP